MHIIVLALGCSDYGMGPRNDGQPGTDTADPFYQGSAQTCSLAQPADYEPSRTLNCAQEPVLGTFTPVLENSWSSNSVHPGYDDVMAQPIVANLNDDNGDGKVDEDDTPDIVFTTFTAGVYYSVGTLVAVNGADFSTMWSSVGTLGGQPTGSGGVAVAVVEGIITIYVPGSAGLMAFDAAGQHLWTAATPSGQYGQPAVADIDLDGDAEIVLGASVVDHNGTVLWTGAAGKGGAYEGSFPMDLDGDGPMEIIAGNTIYEADGTVRWTAATDDSWPAVGDLTGNGKPEIILSGLNRVEMLDVEGNSLWVTSIEEDGGPPTIADFDGDGEPEIGVASLNQYRVFEADGSVLWQRETSDYSSGQTGSSVFDFEGDGAAEVVYADEHHLWIYDGASGAVELQWSDHSSGTLFEYPVIVDIDKDGSAEIITAANDYTNSGSNGINVIGDADHSWAAARPIWNQHAYWIDHIADDGTLTAAPTPNWMSHNTFRAGNTETPLGLAQPDLKPGEPEVCTDDCDLDVVQAWFPVDNRGEADARDVIVSVLRSDGTIIEQFQLASLRAGEGTWLGPVDLWSDDFGSEGVEVVVGGGLLECNESNNSLRWLTMPCGD